MTYARARLLLGMFGVGSIVVLSTVLLAFQYPLQVLPQTESWGRTDFTALLALYGCLVAVLFPLDLLGGLVLPNHWRPKTISLGSFLMTWLRGVLAQGMLFIAASLSILFLGRWLGIPGAVLAVASIALLLVGSQLQIAKWVGSLKTWSGRAGGASPSDDNHQQHVQATLAPAVEQALATVFRWGWRPGRVTLLKHHDTGFTGGIVGLPGWETIVLPAATVQKLSPEQLAIMIARRSEAIESGSRTRGLILALAWVIVGFTISTLLPGAGVTSVADLAMTCLGFTLWTFLGLLTLPTLSRQASYAIDGAILRSGAAPDAFVDTVSTLDTLQDDEPHRPAWIETIFHPVPSVGNRRNATSTTVPIAWHAARITLFVSWACMGMLVRAVHCNVGRPELWVMLPTD